LAHIQLTHRFTCKADFRKTVGKGSTVDVTTGADTRRLRIIGIVASGAEIFQSGGADTAGGNGGTVSSNFNSFDGNSRQSRIRYDTPKFGGLQVSIGHSNTDEWGVALRYAAKIGGMSVKAAIAHTDQTHTSTTGTTFNHGSVSVLFPQGISLAFGAADQDTESGTFLDDEQWRYAKIGYKFKGSNTGETRLFAEISQNDDATAAGNEAEYIGFGIVQIVEPIGAEVFASYRQFSLDTTGTDPDDITSILGGIRFAF
jgi:predicted porin